MLKRCLFTLPLMLHIACSGGSSNPDMGGMTPDMGTNNPNDMGMLPPVGDCPGAMDANAPITVCDLKLDGSPKQPAIEDPIVLQNVVVTTPTIAVSFNMMGMPTLASFFVQDQNTTAELGGRYSGIAVVYNISDLQAVPAVGDVIDIEGIFAEFGRDGAPAQRQVRATFITPKGNTTVNPVVVDQPGSIASGQGATQYEGVLVQVNNVVAQTINPMGAGGNMIFGFQTADGLIVSTTFTRYFAQPGEPFTSLVGVLRLGTQVFDSGIYSLSPRTPADIVSGIEKLSTIKSLQDPSDPNAPSEVCTFDSNGPSGNCPRVELNDVVVTAVGGFVNGDLRSVYVMDDTVADGRFAGVKVVYDTTRDQGPIPTVGDRISVSGELIDFFRSRQVQNPTFGAATGNAPPTPIVVSPEMLARTETPEASPYEGVLVQVQNITVIEGCVDASNGRDFGNWLMTGNIFVGADFQYSYNGMRPTGLDCNQVDCSCAAGTWMNDMRMTNDMFSSVTGVMDYGFGDFRFQPRFDEDLVR